jgi:hypothetical protein
MSRYGRTYPCCATDFYIYILNPANRSYLRPAAICFYRKTPLPFRLVSPFEKSLVLVGAGNLGKQVLYNLRQDGIELIAFADNSEVLEGKYIDGVMNFLVKSI